MSATRYASALGLGFGDCGKGHFIDALTRRWRAHTVVRFNGGAQAGHNVVTPRAANLPSRHHTFSQFGSGTFAPGVRTLLVDPMVVHPTALLVEAEALNRVGVSDALSRLMIDERCRVTTPFHQAAGRLRELHRGEEAHGTCGVGVGETVRHGIEHGDQQICYGDLFGKSNKRGELLERLQIIRRTLLADFPAGGANEGEELRALRDESIAGKWLATARALARQCVPASWEAVRKLLEREGCVLFEGAQGALLDEWRGFHPHTTWSSINTSAVEGVVARFGIKAPIEHYGVLRTYLTRHGAGPFPTCDQSLDDLLPEPHNSGDGWQGAFRRGHPDGVLLRYALESVGRLSGLLVSHLDVFERGLSLTWCESYAMEPPFPHWPRAVKTLPLSAGRDLEHQLSLTQALRFARPQYDAEAIRSGSDFMDRISRVTSLPVMFRSSGATCEDVQGEGNH